MIDLNSKRQEIFDTALKLFEKFVSMPQSLRPDDKERTGIQVVAWQPDSRNLVLSSIKTPSEAAQFFAIEKAVRSATKNHVSSENSANFSIMRFPGSVSVWLDELLESGFGGDAAITVSTSGLKAEEDVAISVAILAKITGKSFVDVCNNIILFGGILPAWYSQKDKGYFKFLFE